MKLGKSLILTLFVVAMFLAACSAAPAGQTFELKGSGWVLSQINGQPVLESSAPTLVFDEKSLGGNGSCNSFGGDYRQDGEKLEIGPVFSTMMACADAGVMEQETAYLAALDSAAKFKIEAGKLVILDADDKTLLVFEMQDTALDGKTWILTAYAASGGVTTPLPDTRLTAQFVDGKLSGSGGCNDYFAEFSLDGDKVKFGAPGSTKMFCETPDGLMQQESDFLQAFSQAATYRIEGRVLNFYNAEGQTVLQFLQEK
jgi:heat shock protein HslJ